VTEDEMALQVQLVIQVKKVTMVLRDPKATRDLLDHLGYVNTIYKTRCIGIEVIEVICYL
jgi:hypothetical protein